MKTTIEFLDALKVRHHLPSDYALAKMLKLNPNRISNYRTGTSRFDDEMCVTVAAELDLDPGYVLACVAAERTHSESARREWAALAKKLSPAAAALCMVALLAGQSFDAAFALLLPAISGDAALSLYIMLNAALLALAIIAGRELPHRLRRLSGIA